MERRAWIIRHGQSESNAGLATQSAGSARLTDRGRAQARHVAAAFPAAPDLVVVSPYERAVETAAATIDRFPRTPVVTWPVEEFTYLSAANRKGTDNDTRRPLVRAYWDRADPFAVDGEGAESFAAFLERVRGALERLARAEAPFTAVFGHGLFQRALLWLLLVGPVEPTPAAMRACRAFATGTPTPNGAIVPLRLDGARTWTSAVRTDHLPADLVDAFTWDPAE